MLTLCNFNVTSTSTNPIQVICLKWTLKKVFEKWDAFNVTSSNDNVINIYYCVVRLDQPPNAHVKRVITLALMYTTPLNDLTKSLESKHKDSVSKHLRIYKVCTSYLHPLSIKNRWTLYIHLLEISMKIVRWTKRNI